MQALVTCPRYVQFFFVFNSFPCVCMYLPSMCIFFSCECVTPFSVYFLFISSPVLTYFPRTFSLPHFCVFKRGRNGCPLYHKLTVFLPQFFFPSIVSFFMGMLFFIYLYNTLLVLYTSPSNRLSMFTLFLCLPHLFLLSSKFNS